MSTPETCKSIEKEYRLEMSQLATTILLSRTAELVAYGVLARVLYTHKLLTPGEKVGYFFAGLLAISFIQGTIADIILTLFKLTGQRLLGLSIDSNKLFAQKARNAQGTQFIVRTRYVDPQSFEDYVFVYDPAVTYFDTFIVTLNRSRGKTSSGHKSIKGVPFPMDNSKRMISLQHSVARRYSYVRPRRDDGTTTSTIWTQFFYYRGLRTDEQHADALAKFNTILTEGKFFVKVNGTYTPVQKAGNGW